eukprot:TRINITY_DN10994_c0_g1_i1.p1 TRINITY_DN10994_c0_g1~~TRINITY_DN10994_c0_g1_i1.p1  ORF type:complete len:525 (+),score=74.10 TRINITY_DN10994_c0_g1_i1:53-1576(+)
MANASPRLVLLGVAVSRAQAASGGDENDLLAQTLAWQAITILAVFALALALFGGILVFVRFHQRQRFKASASFRPEEFVDNGKAGVAWGRAREGNDGYESSKLLDMSCFKHDSPGDTSGAAFCETVRELFEEEIARGLESGRIADRLERLERLLEMACSGRSARALELRDRLERLEREVRDRTCADSPQLPHHGPIARSETPASQSSTSPCMSTAVAPPAPLPILPSLVPRAFCDAGTMTESSEQPQRRRRPSVGGLLPPTPTAIDNLRLACTTAQKSLNQRDTQISSLTRELRQSQRALWQQTLDEKRLSRKLNELLRNPTYAPQASFAQTKEIQELQKDITALSNRLVTAKSSELRWSLIVRQQRAYFAQSEKAARDGLEAFKRHVAGEVFIGGKLHSKDGTKASGVMSRVRPQSESHDRASPHAFSGSEDEEMLLREGDAADEDTSFSEHDHDFHETISPASSKSGGVDSVGRGSPCRTLGRLPPAPIDVSCPLSPVSSQSQSV